jgi:molybdenum cofactor biosynthesis protein MoaC
MVNITHKSNTLRIAVATASVTVSKQETIEAIQQRKVPKGDVFEFARAAGLLGVKKTSDVIPDCHPLPVEYTSITYSIKGLQVLIRVEVHTIYKTGVEVEAMHGAAVSALTMYDMLKPIDKGVEISNIRLEEKRGGKSSFGGKDFSHLKAAVLVCSDTISKGTAEDSSGKAIIERLHALGIETLTYEVVPDDVETIQRHVTDICKGSNHLLLITGGTGVGPRDVTPEAVSPLIDKPISGIMERARSYGGERMPLAMLSRGVAGLVRDTLVLTLPGSKRGVEESMDALFPHVLHVFAVMEGKRH